MLYSHVAIGAPWLQCVIRRPSPKSTCSTSAPFATTWYCAGAVTRNSPVALSYGWSTVGSHWCARSGQFALKKHLSPYWFLRIFSPPAGVP